MLSRTTQTHRADLGLESPSYGHSSSIRVSFVSIRGDGIHAIESRLEKVESRNRSVSRLRLFVCIRGDKNIHGTQTAFGASRETISQAPHPRTPVRGSPDRTPKIEYHPPKT